MIPFRGDHDDVVATFEFEKWVMAVYGFQTHFTFPVFHFGNKPQPHIFCLDFLTFLLEIGIQFRNAFPELLQ